MTDIRTAWDPAAYAGDWVRTYDLETDEGLVTPVLISLATDRLAEPDDEIPDGSGDRRGWWGDMPIEGGAAEDRIGSRLWLLRRALQTEQTRQRAILYAREALQWMLDMGVAGVIDIEAEWRARGFLAMFIIIRRVGRDGRPPDGRFDRFWLERDGTLRTVVRVSGSLGLESGGFLATEEGAAIATETPEGFSV